MFQDQTSRAATAAELALLKTESARPIYAGFTADQIAAALNAPRAVANPAPQGAILPASVPKDTILAILYAIKDGVSQAVNIGSPTATPPVAPDPTKAGLLTYLTGVVSDVQAYPDPLDLSYIQTQYLPQILNLGLITPAQVDAKIQQPDPSYQATIAGGPRAFSLLGDGVLVEAADITAAQA